MSKASKTGQLVSWKVGRLEGWKVGSRKESAQDLEMLTAKKALKAGYGEQVNRLQGKNFSLDGRGWERVNKKHRGR